MTTSKRKPSAPTPAEATVELLADAAYDYASRFVHELWLLLEEARPYCIRGGGKPSRLAERTQPELGRTYGHALAHWGGLSVLIGGDPLWPELRDRVLSTYPAGAPAIGFGKLEPCMTALEAIDGLGWWLHSLAFPGSARMLPHLPGHVPSSAQPARKSADDEMVRLEGAWFALKAWSTFSVEHRETVLVELKEAKEWLNCEDAAVRLERERRAAFPRAAAGGRSGLPINHAPDFAYLVARDGTRYDFRTRRQREIVGVLFERWQAGGDGALMTEAAIIEEWGGSINRLRVVERFREHPALGTILCRGACAEAAWALHLNAPRKPK